MKCISHQLLLKTCIRFWSGQRRQVMRMNRDDEQVQIRSFGWQSSKSIYQQALPGATLHSVCPKVVFVWSNLTDKKTNISKVLLSSFATSHRSFCSFFLPVISSPRRGLFNSACGKASRLLFALQDTLEKQFLQRYQLFFFGNCHHLAPRRRAVAQFEQRTLDTKGPPALPRLRTGN